MRFRASRMLIWAIAIMVVASPSLFAQKVEVHPYAGGFWPQGSNIGQLQNEGIYGIKAGVFFDPNFQLEGNFGYINNFTFEGPDPRGRGYLWELVPNYNFSAQDWPLPQRLTPYLSAGLGGLTVTREATLVRTVFRPIEIADGSQLDAVRTIEMESGDTFFVVSFGGGIKSLRIWGPLGLRGDVRGRLLPNFYGSSPIWFEATGGINFAWGER